MEYDRQILKSQIKEELRDEMRKLIIDKLRELVGPVVSESIGNLLDFPLTVKQMARLTGRTEQNIYKMCQRDQIPYTKAGKQIHINLRDVNDQLLFIRKHE